MAFDTNTEIVAYPAPEKDLYEVSEMPPLGYVPKSTYAWAIRRERHGEPDKSFQVEVVYTPTLDSQDDGDDEECNGGDPMFSASQRIWGYETPDGSFAQFTRVHAQQLMPRPKHLT